MHPTMCSTTYVNVPLVSAHAVSGSGQEFYFFLRTRKVAAESAQSRNERGRRAAPAGSERGGPTSLPSYTVSDVRLACGWRYAAVKKQRPDMCLWHGCWIEGSPR